MESVSPGGDHTGDHLPLPSTGFGSIRGRGGVVFAKAPVESIRGEFRDARRTPAGLAFSRN